MFLSVSLSGLKESSDRFELIVCLERVYMYDKIIARCSLFFLVSTVFCSFDYVTGVGECSEREVSICFV